MNQSPWTALHASLNLIRIYLLSPDIYATGIRGFAAKEREQQIQCWEAENFDFRATTWASAGEKIQGAIAI
ncbi:hypothetical protein EBX93_06825, partial [bacterium]|nr:hypothetical protein [bacterium]